MSHNGVPGRAADARAGAWGHASHPEVRTRARQSRIFHAIGCPTVCAIALHNEMGSWPNGLNVKAPLMHFGEKSVLAAVGNSLGSIRVSFSLPEKSCFDEPRVGHQHLVVSIYPLTGLYDSERAIFMTPFLPELNEYYGRNYYFFQGCNQDRQVFGIGLPCIGGQVIGFWIGHHLQTTADDKSQFRQLTRQFIRKVAFNFGDGLGRGDTLDQGDSSQSKHNMAGTMLCRRGSLSKDDVRIKENDRLFH
jgi:hypothetical protein